MRDRSIFPYCFLLGLAISTVTGCDAPCSADCESLSATLGCYRRTQTCRPLCTRDIDCSTDQTCVLQEDGPQVCGDIAFGGEGEACYGDQTCDWGFRCNLAVDLCENMDGEREGRCGPGGACNEGLECVADYCRSAELGDIGETCYAPAPQNPNPALCQDETAACELGICRGGAGDVCDLRARPCRSGFRCDVPADEEAGECLPNVSDADAGTDDAGAGEDAGTEDAGAAMCTSRDDCSAGEFCCGEAGTQYETATCLGADGVVTSGACFPAPSPFTEATCEKHKNCPMAPLVPTSTVTGPSMCMPFGAAGAQVCSVPCDAGDPVGGCPAQWSCGPEFTECLNDDECGGLTCAGAQRNPTRFGRCVCDPSAAGLLGTCSSTVSGHNLGTCAATGDGGFACKGADHCIPPGL